MPGSFLDAKQVPFAQQKELLLLLINTVHPETVRIESRPEYVARDELGSLVGAIRGSRLEVSIGLETSDEAARLRLGKGFTNKDFEGAAMRIADAGAHPVAYLLTGLRARKNENPYNELLGSAKYICSVAEKARTNIKIALECYFPTKDARFEQGAYLTSGFVARAAKEIMSHFGKLGLEIATWDEGLGEHPLAKAAHLISLFNKTQETEHLEQMIPLKAKRMI